MNDVDFILDLLEGRSSFHHACSYPDEDIGALVSHYRAKRAALDEITTELRAARVGSVATDCARADPETKRRLWVLAVEMGGCCRAFLFRTEAEAQTARKRYIQTFYKDDELLSGCNINQVDIAPRRTAQLVVDGRYALVWKMHSWVDASIHETKEELDAAIEVFKDENEWELEEDGALLSYHAVLIPRAE